jgi:hypothetical protein
MVPVYVPSGAVAGTVTTTVGLNESEFAPTAVAVKAVRLALRSCLLAAVACPGVLVTMLVVAVVGPDQ